MSDQTVESDFLREVQAFVSDKWNRNPCERCGTHEWSVLPDNALLSITAHTPSMIQVGGRHIPYSLSSYPTDFIPIYCNNCGNTVAIYFRIFDEWRKARIPTT
jgi:hypothetical protein